MKRIIVLLILLSFYSCSVYDRKLKSLASQIEAESKIGYAFKPKKIERDTFRVVKNRNIKLRLETFLDNKKQMLESKKETFYLIESYDYDWGVSYANYISIDDAVVRYDKDRALLKLTKDTAYGNGEVYVNQIIKKLNVRDKVYFKNMSHYDKKKYCWITYHIYEIDRKTLKLMNHFTIVCFDLDEVPN
ncbi:hypothetical protein NAT51_19225 [Flavobacterium amniphilum]|uniref:hypothetical protein n=1 Tax=Flavobacterium amniphilum TaxID=1834035 RepID=UPI002029E733|nr:hypothetical protein [Flavobacterium amniphilum]MCL9807663.1 hypothetical protein [Flavobacterium amniphilum]